MGLFNSPNIVRDGLILCLDAANPRSYTGSNTWFDISGSNHNGICSNLSTVQDVPGRVVSLDSSSGISVSFPGLIDKYTFTISYWGRPTATPDSNYQSIWYVKHTSNANTYFASDTREVATPSVLVYVRDVNIDNWDTRIMINQAEYNNYRWHNYVTVMRAENDWRSYLDGKLLGTNTTPNQNLTGYGNINQLIIGGSSANFNISNLTVHRKSLSDSEILQNFNALRGRHGL